MAEGYSQNDNVNPSIPTVTSDNRDPNGINRHLQLNFFNVIAEPDPSAYNFKFLHEIANKVYQYSKLFIYRLLTSLVGLPLMLAWGLIFGIYTFAMIWIAVPIRRLCQSVIAECGFYTQTMSDAIIAPIFRSLGQIYSNVHITLFRQPNDLPLQIQV
ncbi:unnamed protein product [Rotaria sp. Silwood1]|nr:unnamed protein product [Rotaria sp. Silwood1]CAF0853160.1 unnamed protein product [Rotaria sp. Silwood1]CAF0868721.1 unnamed protein product [Rotaria sp. Silwood1]CAF3362696.1 unnamed protein product [Rotaria sp. Silwood1]CAF3376726.1 unnamed protein product [Rotaria sp. Silwood1]